MSVSGVASGSWGQAYQFGATVTRSTGLQVTTAEGDVVTLSTSSTRAVGYAGVSASADGTTVSGAAYAASESDRVTLSVEGDLNKGELQDVLKIVKAFERAARKGDVSQFLHRLTRPDLDTVAAVSASARTDVAAAAAFATTAITGPVAEPAVG